MNENFKQSYNYMENNDDEYNQEINEKFNKKEDEDQFNQNENEQNDPMIQVHVLDENESKFFNKQKNTQNKANIPISMVGRLLKPLFSISKGKKENITQRQETKDMINKKIKPQGTFIANLQELERVFQNFQENKLEKRKNIYNSEGTFVANIHEAENLIRQAKQNKGKALFRKQRIITKKLGRPKNSKNHIIISIISISSFCL